MAKDFDLDGVQRRIDRLVSGGTGRSARAVAPVLHGQIEVARVAAMLAAATPPDEIAAAPVAPARGVMELCDEWGFVPGSQERTRLIGRFWRGADQLSVMCRQAAMSHARRRGNAAFVAPFTPGQIAMAERYRALVEAHDAGGVRCSSLETGRGGGGGGGEFIDAYIAVGSEIAAIRRRIGAGEAMALRRIRPSQRGSRAAITDRALVDRVCLGGATLAQVLAAHGWVVKGDHRAALRAALAAALDRMQGYRGSGDAK